MMQTKTYMVIIPYMSLPSGPITRPKAKRFKGALNGLIQENWANSKKTKMGSNNDQGFSLCHQSN
jgi:hypothetical protein